jgi:hypothetical protein
VIVVVAGGAAMEALAEDASEVDGRLVSSTSVGLMSSLACGFGEAETSNSDSTSAISDTDGEGELLGSGALMSEASL